MKLSIQTDYFGEFKVEQDLPNDYLGGILDGIKNCEKRYEIWFPVTRGLPQVNGYYLATTENGIEIVQFTNGKFEKDIIAWRMLPPIYKGEQING